MEDIMKPWHAPAIMAGVVATTGLIAGTLPVVFHKVADQHKPIQEFSQADIGDTVLGGGIGVFSILVLTAAGLNGRQPRRP
jgi:hypothetical protein